MKHRCSPNLRSVHWALFCALLLSTAAVAPAQAAGAALTRSLEPVVVSRVFAGTPVDDLFVYKFTAADGWKQIVSQVDERDAAGAYVASEDGVMDANDEIVFMSGDVGERATTPISETVDVDPSVILEIVVTNPLNAAEKGYAYLVRSGTLTPDGSLTPYIQGFDETNQVITAKDYVIGWAETFGGLDYLALFGGPDILDRTKLRAEASVGPITQTIDENDIPSQNVILDKAGPVRVIVHTGEQLISATTLAYGSMLETTTRFDVTALPIVPTVKNLRLSLDLLPSAAPATYYDENTAAGVTIDGAPDAVPGTPFNQGWRQLSLTSGTTVQVFRIAGDLQAEKQHYYLDDADPGDDTGDGKAYGDSGLLLKNPQGEVFTIYSAQYFLAGAPGNVGATWYANNQTPLAFSLTNLAATEHVYLPLALQ